MKILFLTGDYPTKDRSTTLIFVHKQVKALYEQGYDVAVLTIDLRSIRRKRKWGMHLEKFGGINIYRFSLPCGPVPLIFRVCSNIATKIGFKKVIKDFGMPDILHAHFSNSCYNAMVLKKKYKLPYIYTEHSSRYLNNEMGIVEKKIKKTSFENADAVISVSMALKKEMCKNIDKFIQVLPNIVSKDFFYNENCKKYDKFTFLSVGNLNEGKRFFLTIDAFLEISKKYNDIQLIIVGDGPLYSQLNNYVIKKNLKNKVKLFGNIANDLLPEIYRKSHCFVLPSAFETFGVVYIEALASGLPVIATKCGGPEEIIDKQNGILVAIDDLFQLSDAFYSIYENYRRYDQNLISKRAIEIFSEEMIVSALVEKYKYALNCS